MSRETTPQLTSEVSPDKTERRFGRNTKLAASFALAAALAGGLTACGDNVEAAPANTPAATAEATPNTPSPTPETTAPVVETIQPPEYAIGPDVIETMSPEQLTEAAQISVEGYPTVEAYVTRYAQLQNDIMTAGFTPSQLETAYKQGIPGITALSEKYFDSFAQALMANPERYEGDYIIYSATLNAAVAHNNGEAYVTSNTLCSFETVTGSAEEGNFTVKFFNRRQDNMSQLPKTSAAMIDGGQAQNAFSTDIMTTTTLSVTSTENNWKVVEIVNDEVLLRLDPIEFCSQL